MSGTVSNLSFCVRWSNGSRNSWARCTSILQPEETKYFVSNAPEDADVQTLLLVAFSRWRIERCFEDQKGEVGLDHYEGRRYPGLKRHLILSAVSFLFLARVLAKVRGEKSG